MNEQITKLFEAYKDQRAIAEDAKEESRKQNKILAGIEYKLVQRMLESQVKQIKTDDDVSLHLKRKIRFSCTEMNREQTREWLVTETGDDESYVEEVISKEALGAFVSDQVEQGATERDFPEFLKVNLHPSVSVLGWKKAKEAKEQERTE